MSETESGSLRRLSQRSGTDDTGRLATQRDRDRVLYSESFRRLGAVTQVAIGAPETLLHNRLTHSLKVEQVGLSIFRYLKSQSLLPDGADEWAIAAACLAHDLGHPPFGHAGEEELHALVTCPAHREHPRTTAERRRKKCVGENACKLEDGFEGNAQSFRILTALAETGHTEAANASPRGLDLTVLTLRAATKYPWMRGDNPKKPEKWGAYDIDAETFSQVVDGTQKLSFEAEAMDWADDIAYAVHDIEDFHRTGHIPLDQYMSNDVLDDGDGYKPREAFNEFLAYVEVNRGSVSSEAHDELIAATVQFPATRFTGATRDFKALATMRGYLLDRFIGKTTVTDGSISRDVVADEVNRVLKQLIWYHVIDEPRLTNIQTGQRRLLREIFEEFAPTAVQVASDWDPSPDAPLSRDMRRLPHALQRCLRIAMSQDGIADASQRAYRALLDYLSGMSEPEAYRTHAVLKGLEPDGRLESR